MWVRQPTAAVFPTETDTGYWCRVAARAALALAFVMYAAAKFTGARFAIPGYLLDTPVTDLGGMDLTWAFFAYSPYKRPKF